MKAQMIQEWQIVMFRFIHTGQKIEAAQMPTGEWINKIHIQLNITLP